MKITEIGPKVPTTDYKTSIINSFIVMSMAAGLLQSTNNITL